MAEGERWAGGLWAFLRTRETDEGGNPSDEICQAKKCFERKKRESMPPLGGNGTALFQAGGPDWCICPRNNTQILWLVHLPKKNRFGVLLSVAKLIKTSQWSAPWASTKTRHGVNYEWVDGGDAIVESQQSPMDDHVFFKKCSAVIFQEPMSKRNHNNRITTRSFFFPGFACV